jgi:ABC-2 type transport system ATP-binding protein
MYNSTVGMIDVNCSIPKGGVGLLGPNGAGKTTLIRTLLGIIRPTNGTARVLGYDIRSEINQIRDRIGYMPEYTEMYIPDTTAMKFVTLVGKMGGLSNSDSKQRASDTLYYVGLAEERHRQMKSFSQGMLQKFKLAVALVHDPEILILDEPTNNLDPKGRIEMLKLILALQKNEGKNIILSSHLLKDVERTTDYVVVMGNGKIIAQDELSVMLKQQLEILNVRVKANPEQLVSSLVEMGHKAFIRREKDQSLVQINRGEVNGLEQDVFKAAHAKGLEIRYMGSRATNLEEIFVSLVGGENN